MAKLVEPLFGQYDAQKGMSDIAYFFGSDDVKNYTQRDDLDTKDEISTYTKNFLDAGLQSWVALNLVPGETAINATRGQ